MLANVKIGQRLNAAFGIILFLLIVITALGFNGIRETFSSVKTMYRESLVPLGVISKVEYLALRNRILVMDMIMNHTPANIEDRNKELLKNSDELDKYWKEFKASQLPEESHRIIQDFDPAYVVFQNQLILAARNKLLNGQIEEATSIFIEKSRTLGPPIFKMIGNLKDIQIKSGKEQNDEAEKVNSSVSILTLVGAGLSILLGVILAWQITKSITTPMDRAVKIAQTVALGDLTSEIDVKTKDETGLLLQALQDMNGNLQNIVSKVRNGTDAIAAASGQIASGNFDLSSRTESQASAIEETASSMEELTETVKQNANNAQHANQLAMSASAVATKGGSVVSEVIQTMTSINESSKKIVDIISVIDGIAFQTNILALNAAVEAARAGEQGRGFAVVASEVRNLAHRSASAAKEIKQLIDDSVNKIEAGTHLVDQAGITMSEIVISIKQVTEIMNDISAASLEQTDGLEQINHAIDDLDNSTQQNAALVEEAAAAAGSLQEQASRLAEVVGIFKLDKIQQLHSHAAVIRNFETGLTSSKSIKKLITAPNVVR